MTIYIYIYVCMYVCIYIYIYIYISGADLRGIWMAGRVPPHESRIRSGRAI